MANKKRVLVVDDEVDLAEMVADQLEIWGYSAVFCHSGNDALAILKKDPVGFCLLVSDIRMQHGTGIDLVEGMIANNLNIPTIFMTGYADLTGHEMLPIVVCVLKKPFQFSELKDALALAGV